MGRIWEIVYVPYVTCILATAPHSKLHTKMNSKENYLQHIYDLYFYIIIYSIGIVTPHSHENITVNGVEKVRIKRQTKYKSFSNLFKN